MLDFSFAVSALALGADSVFGWDAVRWVGQLAGAAETSEVA
jgi:hypothetical protein